MKLCPACSGPVNAADWACARCGHRPPSAGNVLLLAPQAAYSGGAFPPASFARLAALEERNYWFRSRNRLIVWALRRYFPQLRSYLEVGCGTGCVLSAVEAAFPAISALGSEIHLAGLERAAERIRRARLVQMDAASMPFRDEFDVIGCFDVLEHIRDDAAVLAQCFLAVRRGGGLLLTVPQHPSLWSAADDYAGHVRRYRRSEILARVAAAGFRPLLATSFVSLLFPLMWASRRRQRAIDATYDPDAELDVGPISSLVLERVLDFERALIRLGVRFPFGGSLLVLAQKVDVDPVQ
jgi:SAM-dependent methyltransferase